MNVLSLAGATKRFGRVTALDGVSLDVSSGTTVALLGPNGAGKSTLISLVLGLRRPDRGTVRLLGGDPRAARNRRLAGYAPQEAAFPTTLRVRELVDFVARHFPRAPDPADLLESFGVLALAPRQAGGLSGGQKRRLAVALAFVGRPRVVVLDEPTAGLDADGRRAVWAAIDAARAADAAVLLATHHLEEAEAVASRVVGIDRGRVVADGTAGAIRARAGRSRVVVRLPDDLPAGVAPGGERLPDGRVLVHVEDPGAFVGGLVRDGIELRELEVSPLALDDALAALRGAEAGP